MAKDARGTRKRNTKKTQNDNLQKETDFGTPSPRAWRTGNDGRWRCFYGIERRGRVICSHLVVGAKRGVASLPRHPAPTIPLTEGILAHCLSSASSFPPVTAPAPAQGRFAPDPSLTGQTSASSSRATSVSMGHGLLYHPDGDKGPGPNSWGCLVVIDSCLSHCCCLLKKCFNLKSKTKRSLQVVGDEICGARAASQGVVALNMQHTPNLVSVPGRRSSGRCTPPFVAKAVCTH